jgi:hypothetical protein
VQFERKHQGRGSRYCEPCRAERKATYNREYMRRRRHPEIVTDPSIAATIEHTKDWLKANVDLGLDLDSTDLDTLDMSRLSNETGIAISVLERYLGLWRFKFE